MHSLAMSLPRVRSACPGRASPRLVRVDDELQRCYLATLQTLAETRARAEPPNAACALAWPSSPGPPEQIRRRQRHGAGAAAGGL